MFRNFIGGLFFVILMFLTTFFGAIFMMGPTLPLLFFKPSWFRYVSDKLMSTWLGLPVAILEILFGMKVHITTDNFPSNLGNEKAIIIMNHRTRLDWMYYWSVIMRQGKLQKEKIILKNELKHIPGAGWAMQIAMFLFLKRNWEKDEKYLHQILRYFTDIDYPLQLLIFPEGTDYDVHSIAKSKSYAEKNNLQIYKHVLHPRLRGFTYCVEQLRSRHGIDAIYDVTIGYLGNICQSEFDLAMGNLPQNVHFHLRRHPITDIPESIEGLEQWCTEKWAEKEARLDQFYKDGRFFPDKEERSTIEPSIQYQMIFWILYWLTFLCVAFILLYNFWWVRWYAAIVGTILFLQSSYGGGFEMLQVKRHLSTVKSGHKHDYLAGSEHYMQNSNGKNHTT